jgi:ABC-type multidrug transport system fused ATPase/permease subunit
MLQITVGGAYNLTLPSLRSNIGIVPQDPTLFNDSIMNNVRYAKLTAGDNEVYEACKAAAIHDKIMLFPDGIPCLYTINCNQALADRHLGYNSKVGNQGMYD